MPAVVRESGVLKACLDLLTAEGIFHRRWNVGAVKVGKRFFRFGNKGDADILALPQLPPTFYPIPLWIECKGSAGRLTAHQLQFADIVRARGHHWLVVDDVSQLIGWLRDHRAR